MQMSGPLPKSAIFVLIGATPLKRQIGDQAGNLTQGAMMDFGKLLSEEEDSAPVEPRELYASLAGKAPGYGYLRDVQGQILTAWHARRDESDLVVKVNTGGGKTIDGLIMLQSYLNEGILPALYVAPSNYLVTQVRNEAARIGISTVDSSEHSKYLSGEAIAVVNVDKLVNGRSIFSYQRPTKAPVPIGAVVIDDAHAALAITRQNTSLEIPRLHVAYGQLLALFQEDIRQQSPNSLLDVNEQSYTALARVPFWAWRAKIDQARGILHGFRETDELKFRWPAISDVLHLCRVVFTGTSVSITPPCPPIGRVSSFMEAKRRIYLTATLADDSVLVTDFGAKRSSVENPIVPSAAGDIGERMILAPQEINPSIIADDVREAAASLSSEHNVVVIVPSENASRPWRELGARVVSGDHVADAVESLKNGHLGLVVLVNRYDGIDLPDDACRVLVLDGLPEAFSGDDRLQAQIATREAAIDDRQVQRIEQGMGRGVRSNEDHCVVILLGARLGQLVADPRSLSRFGTATRAQFELSRKIATEMGGASLKEVMEAARQALDREPNWVKLSTRKLAKLPPATGFVSTVSEMRRSAFDAAINGDYMLAESRMSEAIASASGDREAGWLLEEKAMYVDQTDPATAQVVLANARAKNNYVLRPLSGVAYKRLTSSEHQAKAASDFFVAQYETPSALRLGVESMLDDLVFNPSRTAEFEEATRLLGLHLGLAAARPELEIGSGPDVLWGLSPSRYWVIEAKSGATSAVVHKRDSNQLAGSVNWFGERYDASVRAEPVMFHLSNVLAQDATASPGMKIIDAAGLSRLKEAIRGLSTALAATRWDQSSRLDELLMGHKLRAADLDGYTRGVRPSR